jgi:hypothetical protein
MIGTINRRYRAKPVIGPAAQGAGEAIAGWRSCRSLFVVCAYEGPRQVTCHEFAIPLGSSHKQKSLRYSQNKLLEERMRNYWVMRPAKLCFWP